MKIAVTSEGNKIYQHFGHCPGFFHFLKWKAKKLNRKNISPPMEWDTLLWRYYSTEMT